MLFDQFDQVRIISLSHRTDRRREVSAELFKIGVQIDGSRVAFFDACQVKDPGEFYSAGARGCYLSHLEILESARGSVLILEDDCDFTVGAADYIVPECDVFYGGYYAANPADLTTSDIIGSHMMGYFNPSEVGTYLRKTLESPASRGNVPPPPMDAAIVWYRRAHPDARVAFANPALAHQRPSKTDIGPSSFIDRLPFAATFARRWKRILRGPLRR